MLGAMAGTETKAQARIVAALRKRGAYTLAMVSPPAPVGTPDIVAIYRGIALAIEVKRGARLSRIQMLTLARAQRAGALAACLASPRAALDFLDAIDATRARATPGR